MTDQDCSEIKYQIHRFEICLDLPTDCATTNADDKQPLYSKIWIDNTLMDEPYPIDLLSLTESLHRSGWFDIFTCGCGSSGCAGIPDGIEVTHCGDLIRWKFRRPLSAGNLLDPALSEWESTAVFIELSFNRCQMIEATRQFISDVINVVGDKPENFYWPIQGISVEDITKLELDFCSVSSDISIMKQQITKVVSGGQTGADRAALDVAIAMGMDHGGWCPQSRKAEDGVIPDRYKLKETPKRYAAQRTEWNVRDSDGTLILNIGVLDGGSLNTAVFAKKHAKPCLVVQLALSPNLEDACSWLLEHGIKTLNIAGPRESKRPGIYQCSYDYLQRLLQMKYGGSNDADGTIFFTSWTVHCSGGR